MSKSLFARSMLLQLVLAGIASLIALLVWDWHTALSVLVAGAVSCADLGLMGLAVQRLATSPVRSRIFYTVALGVKFPVLIFVVYLLVVVWSFEPAGLMVGFSSLVLAILYASISYQRSLTEGDKT